MREIISTIEGLFVLYGAIWGILYYTGRLNYTADKEKRRKERVEKYGWLIVVGIILSLIGGLGLLILALT